MLKARVVPPLRSTEPVKRRLRVAPLRIVDIAYRRTVTNPVGTTYRISNTSACRSVTHTRTTVGVTGPEIR